jgi:hypothetical protein
LGIWVFVSWFSSYLVLPIACSAWVSAGSAGIFFNCLLAVGRLLCRALLVKEFVRVVNSQRLESKKVANSRGLLGQHLLVYFED